MGVILTTLAPSFGNFILALLFLYVFKYFPFVLLPGYAILSLGELFNAVIELSIFFGVLDLIPIPPFDGGRLLEFVLPKSCHNVIAWLHNYSIYIVLALFVLPGISNLFFRFLSIICFFVKLGLLFLVF